jgi:Zn-dependent peptidase ImmA (M78 family)
MPRSDRKSEEIRHLARGLLERAEQVDPGLAARLFDDLERAICLRDDVDVVVDSRSFQSNCSIAAAYLRDYRPPRIALGRALSRGRQLFSLGHEFAHHLVDQDPIMADLLFEARDGGALLEEDICDAFAAMILISDDAVAAALNSSGVTAAAVLRLFESCSASREACAVAMAQRLGSEGYVAILRMEANDNDGEHVSAQFCARSRNTLPIGRASPQDDSLLRHAARVGRAQGYARLRFPSGAYTDEYHCDALQSSGYVFAVLVADTPAWGGLSVRSAVGGGYEMAWCEHCNQEFRPNGRRCGGCGDYQCVRCRRCACAVAAAPSARVCPSCSIEWPGNKFAGAKCVQCAGLE